MFTFKFPTEKYFTTLWCNIKSLTRVTTLAHGMIITPVEYTLMTYWPTRRDCTGVKSRRNLPRRDCKRRKCVRPYVPRRSCSRRNVVHSSYVPVWWAGWRCRFRSSLRSAAATDDCSPCRAPPAHTSCRQSPSWWRSNVTWLDVVSVHWVNRKVFDAKSTIRSTQSHNSSEMSPESYNTCLSVSSVFQFPLFIFPISDRFICVCNVLQSHTGCMVYTKPLFTTTWLLCKH